MINVDACRSYLLGMRHLKDGCVLMMSGFAHHVSNVLELGNLGRGRVIVVATKGSTNIMAIYIVQHISQ